MMKHHLITFIFLTTVACAQTLDVKKEVFVPISPGEIRFFEFPTPKNNAKLTCKGQEIKYHVHGENALAIVAASYFSLIKNFGCQVQQDDHNSYKITFVVKKRKYKLEKFFVDPKKIKPTSEEEKKRASDEQEILDKIYSNSVEEFLFQKPFIKPMNSKVTSYYGVRRIYNPGTKDEKNGQHLGTDFRAAIGENVPAANRGKVVFAGDLFYTGWTVIIDHGLEVFSVYGHLSKTLVNAGDIVDRGQMIAHSGNTGRSSAPHLHWGVKVQGQYIDGFGLIEESKKYYRE